MPSLSRSAAHGASGFTMHDMMARITADMLVPHLEASGFVLMKGPAGTAPTTSGVPPSQGSEVG